MTATVIADVIQLVRETIALPESEAISHERLLFYDLNFTSMDMLDLLFRVEQRFQISIPEGTIYALARGDLSDREFEQDGILTPVGRKQLMGLLYDSPPQIFPERIHIATLPRYCTVASIARLVEHRLRSSHV
jgi:acyl carrier protein